MGNEERFIKEVRDRDENTVEAVIVNAAGEVVSTVIVSKHPILRPEEKQSAPVTVISSPLWCFACRKPGIFESGLEGLNDPYPFLKDGWTCIVDWAVDEDGRGPNDMHCMKWYCPECRKLIRYPSSGK